MVFSNVLPFCSHSLLVQVLGQFMYTVSWIITPFLSSPCFDYVIHGRCASYFVKHMIQLKANGPHPRDYSTHRQTPRTDNDSSLLFAESADWRTDRRTDGRYQVHYLPRFVVDNYPPTPRPTDYRHTDKHLRLVMSLIASARRAHTNWQTDGRTLPGTLSPSFAVDKKWD